MFGEAERLPQRDVEEPLEHHVHVDEKGRSGDLAVEELQARVLDDEPRQFNRRTVVVIQPRVSDYGRRAYAGMSRARPS